MNFYTRLLSENLYGPNVIKGKTADQLEYCVKGLMPIIRVTENKFLLGSSLKTVQIRSNKLLVQSGSGYISLAEYWRQVAVSETIKLNKLSRSQNISASKVVRLILEKQKANQQTIADFLIEANSLDELFCQQEFLTDALMKRQTREAEARNKKRSPKKKKRPATNTVSPNARMSASSIPVTSQQPAVLPDNYRAASKSNEKHRSVSQGTFKRI